MFQFPQIVYLSICLLAFVLGIQICNRVSQSLGEHDHSGIVWDEIVGMMVTMAFVPLNWSNLLLGFILFRFFDVVKPWPIRALDRNVKGGLGIMLDDLIAGLFSAAILLLYYQLTKV